MCELLRNSLLFKPRASFYIFIFGESLPADLRREIIFVCINLVWRPTQLGPTYQNAAPRSFAWTAEELNDPSLTQTFSCKYKEPIPLLSVNDCYFGPQFNQQIQERFSGQNFPSLFQVSFPLLWSGEHLLLGISELPTSFLIPIVTLPTRNLPHPFVLIICPSRERTRTFYSDFIRHFGQELNILLAVYGDETIAHRLRTTKPQFVLSTPSIIDSLLKKRQLNASLLEYIFIDSFDDMFQTSLPALTRLTKRIPAKVILCSEGYLHNFQGFFNTPPISVQRVKKDHQLPLSKFKIQFVSEEEKHTKLISILNTEPDPVLVVCSSRNRMELLTNFLHSNNFCASMNHSFSSFTTQPVDQVILPQNILEEQKKQVHLTTYSFGRGSRLMSIPHPKIIHFDLSNMESIIHVFKLFYPNSHLLFFNENNEGVSQELNKFLISVNQKEEWLDEYVTNNTGPEPK